MLKMGGMLVNTDLNVFYLQGLISIDATDVTDTFGKRSCQMIIRLFVSFMVSVVS